ncbi:MAG: PASTA domain-containing protein [Tannerella sp.]|jgi:beta-lactam-binding protein with PASTA domain|nr:PASTA domain-containing protein [Tannerella sp.]
MKSFFDKIFKLPVYIHILAVLTVACITIYIVLKGIDSYTNHNQAVHVPDVRGLQIEDAVPFLQQYMLRYEVVDSIYSKDVTPGAIVELMPEVNSKVKKNRTIYITINAKTEETAPIPEIADISYRQAYALLKARGFMDVEWKYVTGEYRDLTIGVEYGGQMVNSGTRVPLTAKLILVISDGNILPHEGGSAIEEEPEITEDDESWF